MPTIDWNTVATAGATAVIVTLAIEYVAKPRLEARKERILGALRARRELLTAITRLSLAARMYCEELPATAPQDLQRAWGHERGRQYDVLQTQARQLLDDVPRYAHAYPRQFDDVVLGYVTTVHAVMLSMRPRSRKAALVADLGVPVATALEVPPMWNVRAVARMLGAQQEARRALEKIQDGSVASAAPSPTRAAAT